MARQHYYNISDVLEFSCRSTELDIDDLEDLIVKRYSLADITETSISIQIHFKRPEIISLNLANLDTITIKFVMGQIFIDKQHF